MSYASNTTRLVRLQPKLVRVTKFQKVQPLPTRGVQQKQSLRPLLPKKAPHHNNIYLQQHDLSIENGKCCLCAVEITSGFPIFQNQNTNQSEILSQIAKLMGERCIVILNPKDLLCKDCFNLLTYMIALERELEKVQDILRNIIARMSNVLSNGTVGEKVHVLDENCFRRVQPTMETSVLISPKWAEDYNKSMRPPPVAVRKDLPPQPTAVPKIHPDKKCTMCDLEFSSRLQVKKHKMEAHLSTWTCHYCNEKFPVQDTYFEHMKKHQSEFKMKCPNCDEIFATKEEVVEHNVTAHSGEELLPDPDAEEATTAAFMCHLCNVAFITEQDFEEHNQTHGDDLINIDLFDKQVLHELASEEFEPGPSHDLIGMIGEEDSEMQASDQLLCGECESTFSSMEEMAEHYKTEHGAEVADMESGVDVATGEYDGQVVISDPLHIENEVPVEEESHPTDDLQEKFGSNVDYVDPCGVISCARCGTVAESVDWLELHMATCEQEHGDEEMMELTNGSVANEGEVTEIQSKTEFVVNVGDIETQPSGSYACAASAYVSNVVRASKTFPCLHCDAVFNTKKKLFAHEDQNPEHISIKCPDCELRFSRERELNEHREAAHSAWHCQHCQKIFANLKQLKAHETRHVNGFRMKLQCPFSECRKVFQTQSGLRHHMVSHTGEYKIVCEFCNKGFSAKAPYLDHRATHTKEKRYECDVCGKKFSVQATYWIHRKWHDNPEPYKCNTCQKTFKHSSLLSVHKRKHTGERPYECPYCPQSFMVGSSLNRHVTLHTKIYPHVCKLCDFGFTARNKLAMHMSKVHYDETMLQEQIQYKNRKMVMTVDSNDVPNKSMETDEATSSIVPHYLKFETNDREQILLVQENTNDGMEEIVLENQHKAE